MSAPTVAIGDILLVTSHHDAPFTIMFDSRRYRLEPGRETPIPFEAVMLWWGDPRATGSVQSLMDEKGIRSFVADRETEVRRLRTKWGLIGGDETTLTSGTNGAVVPEVVVTDLDGARIYTVADDPLGDATTPVAAPTVVPNADLMAIIQRQQAQIDKLAQIVSAGSANEATSTAASQTEGVPADTEHAPPEPLSPEPSDPNAPPADTEGQGQGQQGQQVPPPPPPPTPPNGQGTPFSELT